MYSITNIIAILAMDVYIFYTAITIVVYRISQDLTVTLQEYTLHSNACNYLIFQITPYLQQVPTPIYT